MPVSRGVWQVWSGWETGPNACPAPWATKAPGFGQVYYSASSACVGKVRFFETH